MAALNAKPTIVQGNYAEQKIIPNKKITYFNFIACTFGYHEEVTKIKIEG